MAQIKFYGLSHVLAPRRKKLSDTVHACVMEALGLPAGKRAHRFIRLEPEDFLMPEGRSEAYTIIEIQLIQGRTKETKKRLVRLLFDRIAAEVGIAVNDIEITLLESAAENWGFRGLHGDEASLPYSVRI
jgi:5-carboxymethyl-2-hydroxymuconate isomerase